MGPQPRTIRTADDATVTATPDHSEITLAVSTSAPTAQAAGTQNAAITDRVLAAVRSAIGEQGTCKTAAYSLNPQYEYNNGSKPKLSGYQAMNTLRVDLDDLKLAGTVIDAALQAGATNVDGIAFTLKDQTAVRREALAQAAIRARSDADAIAGALGLHVAGILDVQATNEVPIIPRPRPLMMKAAVGMESATPIDPGTLEIHASVTLTVQVQ